MHTDEPPTATQDQGEDIQSSQHIQRLDLLAQHFSEAEIQRLSELQRRCRERPDALDLPVEVLRLRYVRWLVEHGRIGADDGPYYANAENMTRDGATLDAQWRDAHDGEAPSGMPPGERGDRAEREPAHGQRRRGWRLSLRASWSRVRQTIGKAAEIALGPEPGRVHALTGDIDPRGCDGMYGPYPLCGPYPPYGSAHSYSEAQWYWIMLRHPY